MGRGWRGITKEGDRKEREIQKGKERKSRNKTEGEYTRENEGRWKKNDGENKETMGITTAKRK